MPADRLESWKRSPPASAKEKAAADLLKQVDDAEALSPQAMHRVAHRLRTPGKLRLPLLADARFAIAALGGVLSLVAIAVVGIQFVDFKDQPTAQTRSRRQEPMLARTEAPTQTPPPAPSAPADFAQPPPAWTNKARAPSAKLAVKKASNPSSQAGVAVSPMADRAEPMLAPAAASAPAGAARGAVESESDGLSPTSGDRCRAEIPGFSATLANNSGDVERALFERGSCWLKLANRDAGMGICGPTWRVSRRAVSRCGRAICSVSRKVPSCPRIT